MSEIPVDAHGIDAPRMTATRPLYWSVRRELWENRSIYLAPLVVAGVFLFGFMLSTTHLATRMRAALAFDEARQRVAVVMPYNIIAGLLVMTTFIVGAFYCLDALQGERRDRSILFWKSLPVSDRTTVLSKAAIPLVVLPALIFAIIVIVHLLMLQLSTAVLMGSGNRPAVTMLWERLPLFQMTLALLYCLIAMALWHAPIYAWLLLVSVWSRRVPLLWAVLPPMALFALEKIVFNTTFFVSLLKYRLVGWFAQAVVGPSERMTANPLTDLTPGNFLITPGLWIGLALAAAFLAVAVTLRRNREPL